jgi:hypothetical protein
VVLNVHANVVEGTPKDTGFAANNWVPEVGAPHEGLAGTRAEAEQGRLDRAPAQAGIDAVRAYELSQGDVHDTNNVDYMRLLNAGSSAQAPAAFVQAAIVRGLEETLGAGGGA